MGQIADDMIEGSCCELCGQYFCDDEAVTMEGYEHGYPVVCWECWADLNKQERKHHTKALKPTF